MDKLADVALAVLAVVLSLVVTVMAASYLYLPSRDDYAAEIAAGNVVVGMNESMVAEAWGPPDFIQETNRVNRGLINPVETYYWIYFEPYRRVTFISEGYGQRVTSVDR